MNMGLLDSVLGSVLGGAAGGGGGGNAQLLNVVLGMLGNDSAGGGLGGLLQKAQQAGLGDVVSSWVGTGQNMPVSADQLQSMLGGDTVSKMAQQAGVNPGDLLGQLSQMLPQVVDQLTPQGQVPQGGLGNVADLVGMFLKR
jgi:uncharacterized protein YidB (DUF937 family)